MQQDIQQQVEQFAASVPRHWWWILLASICLNLAAFHHDTFRMFSNDLLTTLSGPKPFQGRILTFWLAGLLRPWAPTDWLTNVQDYLFILFDALSLLGASWVIWQLVTERAGKAWGLLALLLLLWQVIWSYLLSPGLILYWPYDWPAILCMSLFLWCVFHPQPTLRLVALTFLASLNRETAILMLGVLIAGRLHAWRQEWPIWCGLIGVWLACRWGVSLLLQGNPGQAFSLYHNDDVTMLRFDRNLGLLPHSGENAVLWHVLSALGWVWLALPLRRLWKRWPQSLLWLGIMLGYLLLLAVVGNLDEPRIWGEFIPVMSLLVPLGWAGVIRPPALTQ